MLIARYRGLLGAYIRLVAVILMMMVPVIAGAQPRVGSTATHFSLPHLTRDGQFTLDQQPKTTTVLYFWTPLSRKNHELVTLNRFYDRLRHRGLRVVGILAFPEDKTEAASIVAKNHITYDNVIADRKVLEDFGVGVLLPTIVELDEKLRVVSVEHANYNLDTIMAGIGTRLHHDSDSRPIRSSGRPSPFLSGLGGASLNALIPGLGGTAYNGFAKSNPTNQLLTVATVGFYAGGLFHLLDKSLKPGNFLSEDDSRKYDDITKVELYVTFGFYGLNILAGYLAGSNHASAR